MNISDEAIEAAAKASQTTWTPDEWRRYVPEDEKEEQRAQARRILEAAAPHIAEQAWDEGFNIGWDAARGEPEEPNPYREEVGE